MTGMGNFSTAVTTVEYITESGTTVVSGVTGNARAIYLSAGDFTAPGRTPVLRLRGQLITNAPAPGAGDVTVGLYPVASTSGATTNIPNTLGPVVAGSTVTFSALAGNQQRSALSTEIAIPADGMYAVGVSSTATTGGISALVGAQVQVRNP